jgi:hypothetical protein
MDAYTHQSLDGLFLKYKDYDFIVSYLKNVRAIGNLAVCGKTTRCINNGNCIAKPGSDILRYLIKNIDMNCSQYFQFQCIKNSTGPYYFNTLIDKYKKYHNISKIKIVEDTVLEPCILDECNITPDTYIIHHHANTWINPIFRPFITIYLKYSSLYSSLYSYVVLFLLLVIIYKKIFT